MNKWIYKLSFFIIVLFAFVGASFLSVVFHELSHKEDLIKHIKNNSKLCFLAFPGNLSLKEIIFGEYAIGYFNWR